MKFALVPPSLVTRNYETFHPFLQKAAKVSSEECTAEHLLQDLITQKCDLLCALSDIKDRPLGICILQVVTFPSGKKVLEMPYISGDNMEDWLIEGFEVIKQIAKESGCKYVRGAGRPGWSKVVPDLKVIRHVYECEI